MKHHRGFFPVAFLVALGALPLLGIGSVEDGYFLPSLVRAGEGWRWLTYSWIHVSWYHYLLDAGAFLGIWYLLGTMSPVRRFACLLGAIVGSAAWAMWWSPAMATFGLCGLSGVGHGLLGVLAVEQIRQGPRGALRVVPALVLAGLAAKCGVEFMTGTVVFQGWHAGDLGTPIAACHLGGLLGASVAYAGIAIVRAGSQTRSSAGIPACVPEAWVSEAAGRNACGTPESGATE